MKQQSLFDRDDNSLAAQQKNYWQLYTDGASRNNPGIAGAGIYIVKNGKPFITKSFFLGIKTNNQAEYLALLLGLFYINQYIQDHDELEILADSQLLVRQLQGNYRVKHIELKPLYLLVHILLDSINYTVTHIMREHNKRADALANIGIDKHIPVEPAFIELLKKHNITWRE